MKLILGAKYKKTEIGKKFSGTKDLPDDIRISHIQYKDLAIKVICARVENFQASVLWDVFKEIFIQCFTLTEEPNITTIKVIEIEGKFYHLSIIEKNSCGISLDQIYTTSVETPDNELTNY